MADIWAGFMRLPEAIRWIGLGIAALVFLAGVLYFAWRVIRGELPPEEIERRRREAIHREGKIGDGEIIDVDGSVILYSYSVGGVEYTVGQDAVSIESLLPDDRMLIVGPVSVRFDPRNPPNSIVVCEHWSGLRPRAATSET